jgi:hypothetical protein
MVFAYTAKTVKEMDEDTKAKILAAGIPLEVYTDNYADLGPSNNSALKRLAIISSTIVQEKLPIPPSPMIEWICERTGGKSKQDFTMTLDGKKGMGKSMSTLYITCRYAMNMAELNGHDAKDYFTLDNCALLEDTNKITDIMETADKYQAIIIDDASTALGSRDFGKQSNKNFNKILTVCRTKRWFVILNMPIVSHTDLQIRELVDARSRVYKSFHAGGFNVLKINSSDIVEHRGKNVMHKRRMSFFDKKFDFWVAFSPDILDPFKGIADTYDKQRDDAALNLIREISSKERTAADPRTKYEAKFEELLHTHGDAVFKAVTDGYGGVLRKNQYHIADITADTGLNRYNVEKIIAHIKKKKGL